MKKKLFPNPYSLSLFLLILIVFFGCKKDEAPPLPPTPPVVISDLDGNQYHEITIGTQIWMMENLKVTQLSDSTPIPIISANGQWSNHVSAAACWYDNISLNKDPYGAMYNWYAVSTAKLCPDGWHVPSEAEWNTLIAYLGGNALAGGKLKEVGTDHWVTPNTDADNETSFTGLPGGRRYFSGAFKYFGSYGYWWSTSDTGTTHAKGFRLAYNSGEVLKDAFQNQAALSVRCIKD